MNPSTPPTMTDNGLDRLIRQILTDRADDIAADAISREAMADRIARRQSRGAVGRGWMLLAAAILVALVLGGALAAGVLIRRTTTPPTSVLMATAPEPTASPTEPGASPSEGGVAGWPSTSKNRPGIYSWDGVSCTSMTPYCNVGFMHNGYGSGDVEIRMNRVCCAGQRPAVDEGATAVTVAGHDGTYRRVDARREEWIVEIQGTAIAIELTARAGATLADLDDAHAIIASMRTESRDNRLGFRVIFTLRNGEWDSG